ncbi:hypothetical protein [Chryseobacterium binzhouense]|uniref:hypothetical protein n=1 Tax=Chryseobacterium binzhouense TaxID=2593646 RepID=UPI00117BEEA3|nr:hypothetical protein [Chryseobacterium binzhouense]
MKNEAGQKNTLILVFCLLIIGVIMAKQKELLAIYQALIYVALAITWFFKQIKNTDEILIYKKVNFWLSSGLLLWSTIYIFRILPAYFFAKEDHYFLKNTLNEIYQTSVIITYILFFRGLICKR